MVSELGDVIICSRCFIFVLPFGVTLTRFEAGADLIEVVYYQCNGCGERWRQRRWPAPFAEAGA